jgi:ABC-type phosphate transport system substrate-binding protein
MPAGGHSRTTIGRRTVLGLAASLAAVMLWVADADAQQPATASQWKLIVHPANAVRSLGRDELDRIYHKRNRFWPDQSPIFPLNLPSGDPLRLSFSGEVLREDEDELATFWNRQYFQGVSPPAVLQSSKAVRAYVAATPNAIGYIAAEDVDASVAVVEVTRDD